ncbi:MAG: hypothetical protein M3Y59_18885 [Myxococcota bacterium]|nr:hypothetical protein [Myxococcota bacterium]
MGTPKFLSRELCQAIRRVLAEDVAYPAFDPGAMLELSSLRQGYEGLTDEGTASLETAGDGITWHTFAGGAINRLLAAALERRTGKRWMSGNLSVRSREFKSMVSVSSAIESLSRVELVDAAADLAGKSEGPLLSKFEPCLPDRFNEELWASRMVDEEGAEAVLGHGTSLRQVID